MKKRIKKKIYKKWVESNILYAMVHGYAAYMRLKNSRPELFSKEALGNKEISKKYQKEKLDEFRVQWEEVVKSSTEFKTPIFEDEV